MDFRYLRSDNSPNEATSTFATDPNERGSNGPKDPRILVAKANASLDPDNPRFRIAAKVNHPTQRTRRADRTDQ